MTTSTTPAPQWLDRFVDVLQARRRTWYAAAAAVIVLAALLALLAPSLMPPTLIVGVAVGIAAALLATAAVVVLDSYDLVVRGPRHVQALGGVVAGTISRSPADIDALMALIDAHGDGDGVRVALTPASRTAGVPGARANMVAEELARRDLKVLSTDLTRGRTPAVGLSDVLSGDRKLADAVRFDEELFLAHLAVGSEPDAALAGFADWATSLPPDLDVLVAALPPLAEPGVLPAVQGVELVLVLVEVDRTEKVDLVACLEAIDAAEVPAALVLVDPSIDRSTETSTTVAVLSQAPTTDREAAAQAMGGHAQPVDASDRELDGAGSDDEPLLDDDDPALDGDEVPDGDGDPEDGDGDPEDGDGDPEDGDGVPEDGQPASDVDEASDDRGSDDDADSRARDGQEVADGSDGDGDVVAPASTATQVGAAAAAVGAAGGAAASAAGSSGSGDSSGSGGSDDDGDSGTGEVVGDVDDVPEAVVGSGHVRTVPGPATGGRVAPSRGSAGHDHDHEAPRDLPDDDIDATAREAARLTASLHQLATEVWQRDDE